MLKHFREIYQYRALLGALILRELQARYRGSILGFFWTFLNPMMLMSVYALVFSVYMRSNIAHYTYYVLVGLLPWICFSSSIAAGTSSVSDRRDLLTKVRFPAQVLPSTVVAVQAVNYVLSLPMLFVAAYMSEVSLTWNVLFLPLILMVQVVFTLSIVYLLAALNVGFRDLQHVVGNVLSLWLFLTPVLYHVSSVPEGARELVSFANPFSVVVMSYHAIFYDGCGPNMGALAGLAFGSVLLLLLAISVFERRREEFAETA